MNRLLLNLFVTGIIAFSFQGIYAQLDPAAAGLPQINKTMLKGQLDFLASDWTEGRETGTRGALIASDYIKSMFQVYGLAPASPFPVNAGKADVRRYSAVDYVQSFQIIKTKRSVNKKIILSDKTSGAAFNREFNFTVDFNNSNDFFNGSVDAPVVFAGYGITDSVNKYNDYAGVDVKGKIVLILADYPGHLDTTSEAGRRFRWKKTDDFYYREMQKREDAFRKGALGVLTVYTLGDFYSSQDKDRFRYNWGDYEGTEPKYAAATGMVRYRLRKDIPENEKPFYYISAPMAKEILKNSGIDLEQFETNVMKTMKPASRVVAGKTLHIESAAEPEMVRGINVLGQIQGEDTTKVIVLGAHYDHLGTYNGYVYNGADDNASGTVAVMTLAAAMKQIPQKPKYTLIFAAWGGEEEGLLGSGYWVQNRDTRLEVLSYFNFDMISRSSSDDVKRNKCMITYTKAHKEYEENMSTINNRYALNLELVFKPAERPLGGSDHNSFAAKDIPVISFHAGFPPEYHRFDDHVNKVDIVKVEKIVKLAYLQLVTMAY